MKTKVNTIFVAHNKNWGNTDLYLPEFKKDEPIEMRKFQREVYDNHRDDRFLIINKPQGSGKSSIPKFILTEKLIADPELKVIISYPKNIIAEGFQSQDLIYPDGEARRWEIAKVNNLAGKATQEKVKKIVEFIQKDTTGHPLQFRILCTSHAALVQAFKKIKHKSLRKIQIVVDEGHHVQSGGEDDLSDNNLGRIARCLAKNKNNGCGLWLMTATFFRSNGTKIIRDDLREELFQTYYLPMDTYFNSLRYLRTIQYGYVPYTSDFPEKEIQELLKQKMNRQKVLFFVPAVGRLWVGRNKKHTVKRLKDCVHKVWKEANILDLVDEEGRGSRKDELMRDRYNSDIDVVLSVAIFNEGTDWPECRNVIDLAPSESIVVGSQRFGRPIRDFKGKTHINYYNLFPCVSFKDDPEITRQKLSSCWNALAASMVIADAICDYSIPSEDTGGEKEEKQPREKRIKYFEEEVKDVAKQQQILSDVSVSYTKKMSECKEKGEDFTNDMFEESVKDVLKKYDVVNNQDRIVKEIKTKLVRIAIPKYRVSVSDILSDEYNKITLQKIGDYLMMFSTGKCDGKIWSEVREWYQGQQKMLEDWINITKTEYEEHQKQKKELTHKYMCEKYGSGWKISMRNNREKFEKFSIVIYKGNSLAEWIKITKEEYEEHQKQKKELTHKYMCEKYGSGWDTSYKENREYFEKFNIVLDNGNNIEEWLIITEREYKEHKKQGKPLTRKYMKKKYKSWSNFFTKYREQFNKFDIRLGIRTLEEWLIITEREYKEHKKQGKPLTYKYMKKKYGGWSSMFIKYRGKFNKFNIVLKKKTVKEWLEITYNEYKKHRKQGKELTHAYMHKKYNGAWRACFDKNKTQFEKFNIVLDKGKNIEKWLEVTEKEYKEHKKQGKPLTYKYMRKKYCGWSSCCEKNREQFKKFNIVLDKGNDLEKWLEITEKEYQKHKEQGRQLTRKYMCEKYGAWRDCFRKYRKQFKKFNIVVGNQGQKIKKSIVL